MKPGYVVIRIDRKLYYRHRLVWFYVHGTWPALLDHKEGQSDGIANLRLATHKQNMANARRRKDNKSGFKGVIASKGKWIVRLAFDTPEEAHEAYRQHAAKRYGEFARFT